MARSSQWSGSVPRRLLNATYSSSSSDIEMRFARSHQDLEVQSDNESKVMVQEDDKWSERLWPPRILETVNVRKR